VLFKITADDDDDCDGDDGACIMDCSADAVAAAASSRRALSSAVSLGCRKSEYSACTDTCDEADEEDWAALSAVR